MKIMICLMLLFSTQAYAKCVPGSDPKKCEPQWNDPNYKKNKVDYSIAPVDPAVMTAMKADMQSKLSGSILPNLGDSMAWASGTLTRTTKGELRYVTTTPSYYATTIKSDTDLNELAHASSAINDQFVADFGVDLVSDNPVAQNAIKEHIDDVATKGTDATKEKPLALGNNLSAYNKDGTVVFQKKKEEMKLDDLKKTNEYKALVGANIDHGVKSATGTAKKSAEAAPTNIGNLDYICKAKDSSMMMLVQAAEQYKNKTITKDQFVAVAVTVSKMGDYNNNVAETINEKGINLPAPASVVPAGTVTTCWVNNACVPYVPCGNTIQTTSTSSNVAK